MKDWYLFLFVLVLTWTLMMAITFGNLLCRTTFGGVWSSIVIEDCERLLRGLPQAEYLPATRGWYPLPVTKQAPGLRGSP